MTITVTTAAIAVPVIDDASAAATAGCPTGAVLLGGGAQVTGRGGGVPPPSLHLDASMAAGPIGWAVGAATGKQPAAATTAESLALCLGGSMRVTDVTATSEGPAAPNATARATAVCPAGRVLIGGGAAGSAPGPAGAPSVHLIGDLPSTATGAPVRSGAAAAWTAIVANGGMPAPGAATVAVARCADPGVIATTSVMSKTVTGPVAPGGVAATARAACPAGSSLVGGGAGTGFPDGSAGEGVHLTSSGPQVPAGSAVDPTTWTAAAVTGGMPAFGERTTAFALCAR
ncbi:MAG TPA: hypothetical protein VKY26_06670 [Actinomycetota bacterium]|nr:hypothetical protein [Actinomycetota bacterium]